jgi:hypothetical protein
VFMTCHYLVSLERLNQTTARPGEVSVSQEQRNTLTGRLVRTGRDRGK